MLYEMTPDDFTFLMEIFQPIGPDRFINAAIAILLVMLGGMIIGPRLDFAGPILWLPVIKIFGLLAKKLDSPKRSEPDRITRGFFIALFAILFMGALGVYLQELQPFLAGWGRIVEVLLLSFCLRAGALWLSVIRLYLTIDGKLKQSPGTYRILARTSRIDLSARDDFTLTRTAAETSARMFDKGIVAPALWYLLSGLPGAFIYMTLAALTWYGAGDGQKRGTVTVSAALERILGFIPNYLSGLFTILSLLLVPTSSLKTSFTQIFRSKKTYPYACGGRPVSALAEILGMALGGSATLIDGTAIKRPWTGPKGATAQLGTDHMKRVIYTMFIAHLYFLAAVLGAVFWAY